MRTWKKAMHLFREGADECRRFSMFAAALFLVMSCFEYLLYTVIIYAVFRALDTGSVERLFTTALICGAGGAFYLFLCYISNVYVDMNAFRIITLMERRAMKRLHLLNGGTAIGEKAGEELLNTAQQGARALASYFLNYSRILSGMAVLGFLCIYSLGNSFYILLLLIATVLVTGAGLLLTRRILRGTEKDRQDSLADCEKTAARAVQGIFLRCFGRDAARREYGQYDQARIRFWQALWRQERGLCFIRSMQESIAVMLKGSLGRMSYPDYVSGRIGYDEVATAVNSYDRIREVISRQIYPYQQAARSRVAIDRLEEWYQSEVSREKEACETIRVEGLSFKVGGRPILKNICFSLHQGEKVALIGENGSGKTTLLRCLLGFITPEEGGISYGGQPLSGLTYGQRRSFFSWIPNQAMLFAGPADRNIRMNQDEEEEGNGELSALQQSLLPGKKEDEDVLHFSDGEKQRVNILRGLSHGAAWLIADEPTARLQQSLGRRAMEQILGSADTCLVVTHEMEHLELFDRVLVLREGQLVYDGTPSGWLSCHSQEKKI